ncbi:DUF1559 domain-containing protein [Thalassoglobus sp. JC818]|uniref:DUF1559 domain-containing protein n=1 Tax=Thalassoglobus sp. JC818 TaxID=3232136 RepID=UPI0034576764
MRRGGIGRRFGFTLIELMVVIAVIGLLIALLLPAVQSAREASRRTQCKSSLRQLALALHNYHDAHRVLPSGTINFGSSFRPVSGWGWGTMILPYVDQGALYSKVDFNTNNAVGANRDVIDTPLPFTLCPSDAGPTTVVVRSSSGDGVKVGAGNYLGVESMLSELSDVTFGDVTDGLSSSFMLGESIYQRDSTYNEDKTSSWVGKVTFIDEWVNNSIPHLAVSSSTRINHSFFASRHPGGMHFALGDGHVDFFAENMDVDVYQALGTIDGGETVSF